MEHISKYLDMSRFKVEEDEYDILQEEIIDVYQEVELSK